MKPIFALLALVAVSVLLAGCSSGETLDPKDSIAGNLKGLKNEPAPPKGGMPKTEKKAVPKKEMNTAPAKGDTGKATRPGG
ncbi:hypothetical protein BH11ARM2_BH11ARM2_33620 [soil metagenome]